MVLLYIISKHWFCPTNWYEEKCPPCILILRKRLIFATPFRWQHHMVPPPSPDMHSFNGLKYTGTR